MILGEESVTLTPYTNARGSTTGRTTSTAGTPSTILASVQPANGDDLQTLPEGERTRKARKFYTTTALSVGPPGDRITVGGEVYEVRHVEQVRSVLPHYKAIGIKRDEASP